MIPSPALKNALHFLRSGSSIFNSAPLLGKPGFSKAGDGMRVTLFGVPMVKVFEIEENHKNSTQSDDCQTHPSIRSDRHGLGLLFNNHADYNSHADENQCRGKTDDEVRWDKWFFGQDRENQAGKTQFTTVIKKFGQVFEKEFIHKPVLYSDAYAHVKMNMHKIYDNKTYHKLGQNPQDFVFVSKGAVR